MLHSEQRFPSSHILFHLYKRINEWYSAICCSSSLLLRVRACPGRERNIGLSDLPTRAETGFVLVVCEWGGSSRSPRKLQGSPGNHSVARSETTRRCKLLHGDSITCQAAQIPLRPYLHNVVELRKYGAEQNGSSQKQENAENLRHFVVIKQTQWLHNVRPNLPKSGSLVYAPALCR